MSVLEAEGSSADVGRSERKRLGAYYTPPVLAEWVARSLLQQMAQDGVECTVLDPACGDGSLLRAARSVSRQRVALLGYDIARQAVARLRDRAEDVRVYEADTLADPWPGFPRARPIGVISNPPWGAEVAQSPSELRDLGYTLATGQFDSYDLFLERIIDEVPPGSLASVILPDSLFLPEHEALRELLLSRVTLLRVARLGEGFFSRVYRGTVVLLFRVSRPERRHRVECARLRKPDRLRILRGELKLEEWFLAAAHPVRQSRFSEGVTPSFDIQVNGVDWEILRRFRDVEGGWSDGFRFSRGVELGKSGDVVACECGYHRPKPRAAPISCLRCERSFRPSPNEAKSIIRPLREDHCEEEWRPILAGEDVDRYSISVRRMIRTGLQGIDYKEAGVYSGNKVVVRKTGLGIKAACDENGLWTTQVVYHIRPRATLPRHASFYLQGVLSSRCILAYHLAVTGEVEWRSHPYVTPKVLRTLPIPRPWACDARTVAYSRAIAAAAEKRQRRGPDPKLEHYLEGLVAGLLRLDDSQITWVMDTINGADDVEALASMKLPTGTPIRPVEVRP